jgi:hypothetical protein
VPHSSCGRAGLASTRQHALPRTHKTLPSRVLGKGGGRTVIEGRYCGARGTQAAEGSGPRARAASKTRWLAGPRPAATQAPLCPPRTHTPCSPAAAGTAS